MLSRSWGRTLRTIFTRGVCCSFIQEEYLITFFFSDRVLLRATEVRCLIKVLRYLCLKTQLHSKCDNRNHRSDPKEIQLDKLPLTYIFLERVFFYSRSCRKSTRNMKIILSYVFYRFYQVFPWQSTKLSRCVIQTFHFPRYTYR